MTTDEGVAIIGCGYVGSALAEACLQGGARVWGLRRDPRGLPPGVAPLMGDVSAVAAIPPLPRAASALVYAISADAQDEVAYRQAYFDGLRNTLEAVRRDGLAPRRLIFISSTAVYGECDGEWVDESTPPAPGHYTGRWVLAGEELAAASGIQAVSLRLGGIYGPGRTRLIDRVARGEASLPAGPPRYLNLNHLADIVGAMQHLIRLEQPNPVYLGTDGHPAPQAEILQWLAERLGIRLREADGDGGVRYRGNKRCSNRLLVQSGYAFRYPTYRDGYGALIEARGVSA